MVDQLSPNKQALLKIRELKQQIEALESQQASRSEPIAIVSMACRFPRRSSTPEKFWQSLLDGTDEVSEIPADRWDLSSFYDDDPDEPGRMYARNGVFLDHLDLMDPEFFGISPREATWIDPQQRLLMEVGWEALERAGWIPEEIGEQTGMFVGWMHGDYQNEASDSILNLNPYIATGAAGSFLCGRLSYYLGLQGPSVAVDTACSSSLVALHLACQSLQQRDCDRALVGGVNAIVSPTTNILTCKLRALSPTGQSRAFDAAADGYLRGEGCGVVTLRRLSDAERDGDTILGVIEGSAIGHNGFSSGLTAPNPKAQERVIGQALHRAGLSANDVAYLEAHGTGTELGDPIEMHAAAAALSGTRRSPLMVGSVKTNIGHLEAAAGMAGLIKVLLSMQHHRIPGQLNFETPNPHIRWDQIPVKVLTETTEWPSDERYIAGVSAFGMSGTNAHVVISSHQETRQNANSVAIEEQSQVTAASAELIVLSAKNEDALTTLAENYAVEIESNESIDIRNVAYTAAVKRCHFEHRAAVIANSRVHAVEQLKKIAQHQLSDQSISAFSKRMPKVGWQFTGQGSQYLGMAKGLYEKFSVFREAIDACDSIIQSIRDESLLDVLFNGQHDIHNTHWTQPAIFAIQMGLVKQLQHFGFEPQAVMGHSVGQYAAACVAGVMSWEDGLRLISERGRLIGSLPRGGTMAAVFASTDVVEETIEKFEGVSIAAFNGTHIVISGIEDEIEQAIASLNEQSVRTKKLDTSHAFHSAMMDPVLDEFADFADRIQFAAPRLPLVCNVSGEELKFEQLSGKYWSDHIRSPVQFAPGVEKMQELGCDVLLELGPQAILTRMAAANWMGASNKLITCLDKNQNDEVSFLTAIGKLYVSGATPDFKAFYADGQRELVVLPTYPFQRRRFWGPDKPQASHLIDHTVHPLLGKKLELAGVSGESRYQSQVNVDNPTWMVDHRVMDQVVMPGAGFLEIAVEASNRQRISNVVFKSALQLSGTTSLQTVVRKEGDKRLIETFSSQGEASNWQSNFTATIAEKSSSLDNRVDLKNLRESFAETVDREIFYQKMHEIGLEYGDAFQTIQELRTNNGEVLSKLSTNGDLPGYSIAPPLLDGALHSLAVGLLREDDGNLFLPVAIKEFECFRPVQGEVWCHATWVVPDGPERTANLTLIDASGQVVAEMIGLKVQEINRAVLRQMSGAGANQLLYELNWETFEVPAPTANARDWLILNGGRQEELVKEIELRLSDLGHTATVTDIHQNVEDWNRLLDQHASGESMVPAGIVWVCGESSERSAIDQISEATERNCTGVVSLMQALLHREVREITCGFSIVTTAALSKSNAQCDPRQTQYWGLGKVLAAEQPEFRCRLMDLTGNSDRSAAELESLVSLLVTETKESQFILRGSEVDVARLAATKWKSEEHQPLQFNEEGSYLITGGLGMLGRLAGRWLAENGAKQIVLVSRRHPDKECAAFLNGIKELGCDVVIHAADLGDRASVAELFARFGNDLKQLAGVIHAAGVLDDGLIDKQSWERFEKVLSPKIVGASLLHEFTKELELEFFVLYSSVASVLGSPGQSNYATGNAFLDGLAYQRRAEGLPANSVNWGPWAAGMADNERIVKQLKLQGITPLDVAEAHRALEEIITKNPVQSTVIDVDWRRMQVAQGGQLPPLLESLSPAKKQSRRGDSVFIGQLKKLRGSGQRELLVKTIQEVFQGVLSTPEAPETDRPLIEMGLDSLMAVEFSTELQSILGEQIPIAPTMLFDHPTIDAISDHILEVVDSTGDDQSLRAEPEVVSQEPVEQRTDEPIAIIGMSCRFPGADNIDDFWRNLMNRVDSVREIPADRWDVDRYYDPEGAPGTMPTREGGFVDGIDQFDPGFFNIAESEAIWIDPQHRMLLENSYLAMEHAGIPSAPLKDSNVGVFMGIMGQDYAFLPKLDDQNMISTFEGAGLSHSAGVGRISYTFGFEGPSIAIDTASSSSLVALHQAARSLQDGQCNIALAGGVNAILAPGNSLLMSKAGLLAPDGRCKSFSAAADGFGRGEGCGVLVLKRLSDAEKDGDRILATIRGSAVVHNGFSSGITSPNGKSQSRVITDALKAAKLAPSQVQYLEAHGTGTEFGDPMELSAAAQVYGKGRKRDTPLLVGSVKANISHLEAAGGISGVIKAVLALNKGMIPPQANFEEPSPHVPWKRMPVKMVTEPTEWPEVDERLAGVTALGLIGTNAHLILGGPPVSTSDAQNSAANAEEASTSAADTLDGHVTNDYLLPLSARTPQALTELVEAYLAFLIEDWGDSFADVCASAATGRRHHEYRVAIAAKSHNDAIDQLERWTERDLATSKAAASRLRTVWTFPEKGEVDAAVKQLYLRYAGFREFVSRCDRRLAETAEKPQSLLELVENDSSSGVGQYLELVLYMFQAGLGHLFTDWGIEPELVCGWGVGQYTSTCLAGGLSFEDAAVLVHERCRCQEEIANGANSDGVLERFEKMADAMNFYPPNLPLIDSLTGDLVPIHRTLGGKYWRDHVANTGTQMSQLTTEYAAAIHFGDSQSMHADLEFEIPVHIVLDNEGNSPKIDKLLGLLYVAGVSLDFEKLFDKSIRRHVSLPHYPFQKKRYWITDIAQASTDTPREQTVGPNE